MCALVEVRFGNRRPGPNRRKVLLLVDNTTRDTTRHDKQGCEVQTNEAGYYQITGNFQAGNLTEKLTVEVAASLDFAVGRNSL